MAAAPETSCCVHEVSHPKLKTSRFNHFVKKENKVIGYNFLYRTIIQMPLEVYSLIEPLFNNSTAISDLSISHQKKLTDEWLQSLTDTGFLIEQDIDELNILRFRYYRSLFDSKALSLIILPTLWCNLNCPYCFEFKKPIFMKDEVQDAIMNWLNQRFRDKRQIHVAWFGGEPLLAKKTIFKLTDRLQDFCRRIGANYSASLTTNGYYFDEDFQNSLKDLQIKNVQVTFDGDQKDHDLLRTRRNGKGSFEKIFTNVVSFCKSNSPTRLSIRVNVGDANYSGIPNLLERFPPPVREKATLFFRWIWANEASGFREFAKEKQGSESFQGLAKLYAIARQLGWQTRNPHNDLRDGYCEVDYLDHYDISPEGNVFLCTHTYDADEALGSLMIDDDLRRKEALNKQAAWYGASPWDDPECLSCKLLPVCLGGCRKSRVAGNRPCIEEKGSLDAYTIDTVASQLVFSKFHSNPYIE